MKYALNIIAGLLILSGPVWAATYYVSPAGDNNNTGQSAARPFQVIQHAIDQMKSGDTLIVLDGFYTGTAPLKLKSGITLQASHPRKAVFSNLETISGPFEKHSGNVYKTKMEGGPKQVFHNNQPMTWARWPNFQWTENWDSSKKWAAASTGTGPGVLTSDAFKKLGKDMELEGGYCFLKYGKGNSCYSRRIESFDGKILKWNDENFYDSKYTGEDGPRGAPDVCGKISERSKIHPGKSKFFLAGTLGLLDAPGEWFVKDGILYFFAPDGKKPDPASLLVKTSDYCIHETSSLTDVVFDGVDFIGTSVNISEGTGIVFKNVQFKYIGGEPLYIDRISGGQTDKPIQVNGRNILFERCLFAGAQNTALSLEGSDITVRNCVFMENNRNGNFESRPLNLVATGTFTITRNTFFNNCSDSIYLRWPQKFNEALAERPRISYNNMFNAGIYNSDVSGVYLPIFDQKYTEIHHNWFHNINGNAVRLDLAGSDLSVHHNCFWASNRGLNIEGYGGFNIYNNTEAHNEEESCLVRNVITDRATLMKNAIHVSHTGDTQSDFAPIEDWNVLNNLSEGMVDRPAIREKALYSQSDLHPERKKANRGTIEVRNRGSIQGNLFGERRNIFTEDKLSDLNLVPASGIVKKGAVEQTKALAEQHVTSLDAFVGAYDLGAKEGKGLWQPGSDWMPNGFKVLKTMAASEAFAKQYRTRSVIPEFDAGSLPTGTLGGRKVTAEKVVAHAPKKGPGGFLKLDANGDGHISRDEYPDPDGVFDKIDKDQSGTLTKKEMKVAREKWSMIKQDDK